MDTDRRIRLDRYLINRRNLLKGGLAAAATLAAPGIGGRAFAAPSEPLRFIGWQYHPEIAAENVETFKKLYDENVSYELVPGEYHAVAETNQGLKALIGAATAFPGGGFLLPTRNGELFRWCLENQMRPVHQMTLMTTGLYNEPSGAYLPSVLY